MNWSIPNTALLPPEPAPPPSPPPSSFARVAVVHDWLTVCAGSEAVLAQILAIWPDADLFAAVDFLSDEDRRALRGKHARTSFIQRLPWARKGCRAYLPLMPLAIEQFDVSGYDLVISSSHAVARGILTGPAQLHVSYMHAPMRHAWHRQHDDLAESGPRSDPKYWLARTLRRCMPARERRTARGVDALVASSGFIARRIREACGHAATVVYPPVDIERFCLRTDKESFYFTASRMLPYQRLPLIVEAFAKMPGRRLVVIGDGPELARVQAIDAPNVTLLGDQPHDVLVSYLQRARGFVFAAEDDFGRAPVEAQACGTPVIACGRGGALETVIESDDPLRRTGVFFREPRVDALVAAVERFETMGPFDPVACRANAQRFGAERFRRDFADVVAHTARARATQAA
ncbi:MAG: glycosyltransferase [Burkholderia gladioli]